MDYAELYDLCDRQTREPDRLSTLQTLVISFARWRGLTDEDPANREAAKDLLDRALDQLDVDDAPHLRSFTKTLGAENMRELLAYSLRHSSNDLNKKARQLERLRDREPDTDDDGDTASRSTTRRRRRERER